MFVHFKQLYSNLSIQSTNCTADYLLTPWSRVLLEKLTGLQLCQELPRILWNSKVHYRIHKCPATCPYPEPAQSNSLSHILKIHLNIIHPSTPGSPKWTDTPHQNPVFASHLHYLSHPSHSSRLYHSNHIGCGAQIVKLLIMYSSPLICYLVPLRSKYSPQHTINVHMLYYIVICSSTIFFHIV